MQSEMDLMLMLPAAGGDCANNNDDDHTNNKMVVICRDEESEYLEKLLTEKKLVESTTGLDLTLKLINAGKEINVQGKYQCR